MAAPAAASASDLVRAIEAMIAAGEAEEITEAEASELLVIDRSAFDRLAYRRSREDVAEEMIRSRPWESVGPHFVPGCAAAVRYEHRGTNSPQEKRDWTEAYRIRAFSYLMSSLDVAATAKRWLVCGWGNFVHYGDASEFALTELGLISFHVHQFHIPPISQLVAGLSSLANNDSFAEGIGISSTLGWEYLGMLKGMASLGYAHWLLDAAWQMLSPVKRDMVERQVDATAAPERDALLAKFIDAKHDGMRFRVTDMHMHLTQERGVPDDVANLVGQFTTASITTAAPVEMSLLRFQRLLKRTHPDRPAHGRRHG